jgi:transposase InsO family protein
LICEDIKTQLKRAGLDLAKLLAFYGLKKSTYYSWFSKGKKPKLKARGQPVRIDSVTEEEELKVLEFRKEHSSVGYRKLCWMMVDADIAYLPESTVYSILSKHSMLQGWNKVESQDTAKEYAQKPKHVHDHWHIDIAYIKIRNIFYFLIMVLDGYSRYLLDWDLMTDMTGKSVELFVQRVKEKYLFCRPKLISDNGSQFISYDFKRLVTTLDIQQIFTRRNHPQTNGKLERMNGTVKQEAIRPNSPVSYSQAWEVLNAYAYEYNYQRLHAAIGYLRPADMFFGRNKEILNERKLKLIKGRKMRIETNKSKLGIS